MKILNLILTVLLFTQCVSNENRKSEKSSSVSNEINKETKVITIENQIVKEVQDHYIEGEGVGLKLKIKESDSLNELTFKDNNDFTLMRIEIPKEVRSDSLQQIFFPDFNNDGLKDIVISVYQEGGWSGGNVFDTEIFVFKNEKTNFILKSVNNSKNLTNCNFGQFSLKGQKNGKLIGDSFCYAPDDGHCCPSLEYKTTLIVENWKLKHFTSEKINKTAANNGYK